MKIDQEYFEEIQKITGKDYDNIHVQFSNNAEDENVTIYSNEIIADIIYDLVDSVRDLKQKIEDREKDIEDNYERVPISKQVRISDSDFR